MQILKNARQYIKHARTKTTKQIQKRTEIWGKQKNARKMYDSNYKRTKMHKHARKKTHEDT